MRQPKLRALEAFPIQDGERTYLALRDGEGFSSKLLLLSAVDAAIACRLDGEASAEDIAAELARQAGVEDFPAKRVTDLVRMLDENLMLESDRFLARRQKVVAEFRDAPSRPAFLAGQSYPGDPEGLSKTLDGILELAPDPRGRERCGRLNGLVAPHIDFDRGKDGYARAYREVFRSGLADLYVILGVAHACPETPFVLAKKDFETPFGPAPADHELAQALADAAPYDIRADEFVHRTEHSIEFHAVFLKHVQRRIGGAFKILPLLCSSCDLDGSRAGKRALAFLDALEKLLKAYPGKVCLLAGVDFAHVGPRFGDPGPLTQEALRDVEARDRRSIERVLDQDPQGFLESVMDDGNQRKVCGVAALHAFCRLHGRLWPDSCGELLHYGRAADPAGGEVSFASLSFSEPI